MPVMSDINIWKLGMKYPHMYVIDRQVKWKICSKDWWQFMSSSSLPPYGSKLTLRKIAIWLSTNCHKIYLFFKKLPKIATGNFFEKKRKFLAIFLEKNVMFLAIFWQSNGIFPEGQISSNIIQAWEGSQHQFFQSIMYTKHWKF